MSKSENSLEFQTGNEAPDHAIVPAESVNDTATSSQSGAPLTHRRSVSVPPREDRSWDAIEELLEAPSHVYFIYSAGLVKIGYSTDWQSRLNQVRRGCAHHAELILVMPGDRKMEADYHGLFDEYRERGEWFRCDGKMREFLERFASKEGLENLELAESAYVFATTPRSEAVR
jgi:hypothetical protein